MSGRSDRLSVLEKAEDASMLAAALSEYVINACPGGLANHHVAMVHRLAELAEDVYVMLERGDEAPRSPLDVPIPLRPTAKATRKRARRAA